MTNEIEIFQCGQEEVYELLILRKTKSKSTRKIDKTNTRNVNENGEQQTQQVNEKECDAWENVKCWIAYQNKNQSPKRTHRKINWERKLHKEINGTTQISRTTVIVFVCVRALLLLLRLAYLSNKNKAPKIEIRRENLLKQNCGKNICINESKAQRDCVPWKVLTKCDRLFSVDVELCVCVCERDREREGASER